tara:strand:+ start:617 stop:1018 length:402 start_codon:yes stop_codon:yes gene_type:complete
MIQYIIAYLSTTVVFFALDFLWLGTVARSFYFDRIGDLLAQPFNIPAAVIFYLVYIIGILIFAVNPALAGAGIKYALLYGALFGFFCYATYDMTNLATLKNWSMAVVIVDVIWGTVLTATAAGAGYWLTRLFI